MQVSDRLRWAVENDNLHMVKRILARFPELLENRDLNNGWTSLHYAGYHGHHAICVYLIQVGHDSQEISLTRERNTPLHLAASKNREQTVHYLAQHMSRCLDWKNNNHETALMVAARLGNDPCINLLLDFGADIDTHDGLGNRPIHIAAAYGHLKTLRTLIDRNADTSCQNFEGWRPFQYCSTYQVQDYLQSLIHEKNESTKKQQAFFKPKKASNASTAPETTTSSRRTNIYLPPISHVQSSYIGGGGAGEGEVERDRERDREREKERERSIEGPSLSSPSLANSDPSSPTASGPPSPRITPRKLSLTIPNTSPSVSSPLTSPATTSVTTPVKLHNASSPHTPTSSTAYGSGQHPGSNSGSPRPSRDTPTLLTQQSDIGQPPSLLIPPRKTSLGAMTKSGAPSSPPPIQPPTPRQMAHNTPQLSPTPSSVSLQHPAISMPTFGHTFRQSDKSANTESVGSHDMGSRSSSRTRLMDISVKSSSHVR